MRAALSCSVLDMHAVSLCCAYCNTRFRSHLSPVQNPLPSMHVSPSPQINQSWGAHRNTLPCRRMATRAVVSASWSAACRTQPHKLAARNADAWAASPWMCFTRHDAALCDRQRGPAQLRKAAPARAQCSGSDVGFHAPHAIPNRPPLRPNIHQQALAYSAEASASRSAGAQYTCHLHGCGCAGMTMCLLSSMCRSKRSHVDPHPMWTPPSNTCIPYLHNTII